MENLAQAFHRRKELVIAFTRMTGVNISRFLDPVLGFDIVGFDKYIETPDGISTKDFVTQKWGKDVCTLIERLIQ